MKNLTMKLFLTFVSVCVFCNALNAQAYKMGANIPFAFHAGTSNLPAGHYTVEKPFETQVQSMVSPAGRRIAVAPTGNLSDNQRQPRLVFHHYGTEYFLSEIWNGEGTGTKLKPTAAENQAKESVAANHADTVTVVLAGLR